MPLGAATFALSKVIAREHIGAWVREPFVDDPIHPHHPRGHRLTRRRRAGHVHPLRRRMERARAGRAADVSPDAGRTVTGVSRHRRSTTSSRPASARCAGDSAKKNRYRRGSPAQAPRSTTSCTPTVCLSRPGRPRAARSSARGPRPRTPTPSRTARRRGDGGARRRGGRARSRPPPPKLDAAHEVQRVSRSSVR